MAVEHIDAATAADADTTTAEAPTHGRPTAVLGSSESADLLRAIADVLDVRTVLPQVSAIASRVLPHDCLTMVFRDERGGVSFEAASVDDFPDLGPVVESPEAGASLIFDDLGSAPVPTSNEIATERLIHAGYRSMLAIATQARGQKMWLIFFAKQPRFFHATDVSVARQIADYVTLAVSHEQLAEAAKRVAEAHARAERLERRVQTLLTELDSRARRSPPVGRSAAWSDVLKKATQVAATDTTALLIGESGTGKEVVARFIHHASSRSKGPFVALNCAALPEQLLESELFGYERGAFTGAQQSKPGQIELAADGVLFLDEVTEMSPSAQAKFLRVLQEREFQRLGGTRVIKANVRVIAATNRDLRKMVEAGQFREDLYYRLQVFEIRIAPLRERRDDILALTEAFLEDISSSFGRPVVGLTPDARALLLQHTWPGNVRELRNALERAVILSDGGLIAREHLALTPARAAHADTALDATDLPTLERDTIARALREAGGNKAEAARRLGLSRTQLYVRLRRYGLDRSQ